MGGVDKATLHLGGVTLLDRVLLAARPMVRRLTVVGPARPTEVADVEFLSEPVPGGGPVPAVLAALDGVDAYDVVLVLAADLPFVATADLEQLVAALTTDSGANAAAAEVTSLDNTNPLLAAYRARALLEAAAQLGPGDAARELLPPNTVTVRLPPLAGFNVNCPADLEEARAALAAQTTRSSPA